MSSVRNDQNRVFVHVEPAPSNGLSLKIRLLIADDHRLVREGLRLSFEATEIDIVAEAANGQEAFEALGQHVIDVALTDVNMPVADGFRFLQLTRAIDSPVRVLMHSVNPGHIRRCRELGADGFVVKGEDKLVLLAAVRAVYAGNEYWHDPDAA